MKKGLSSTCTYTTSLVSCRNNKNQNFNRSLLFLPFPLICSRKVLATMDKSDEKEQVNYASRPTFCQRNKSGNGSFVSSLRNHFHEFIHASADEHKTCLRNTFQKILNASKVFGKSGDNTNEGDSVPLPSSTRN